MVNTRMEKFLFSFRIISLLEAFKKKRSKNKKKKGEKGRKGEEEEVAKDSEREKSLRLE